MSGPGRQVSILDVTGFGGCPSQESICIAGSVEGTADFAFHECEMDPNVTFFDFRAGRIVAASLTFSVSCDA
jgi:hypothetical protein